MTVASNPLLDVATLKLCRMLGTTRGQEVLKRVLAESGLSGISTANDLKRFAEALTSQEQGMLKMIGHSLRTEALLRGAQVNG